VREFLAGHIESVEELDVLLLLYQYRDRSWTEAEVDARIRSSESSIQKRLRHLVQVGLVAVTEMPRAYLYRPVTIEMDSIVASLAEVYKDFHRTVIQIIYEHRADPLRSFAKAFELKQKP
jgi:predicted transcriptional regulator